MNKDANECAQKVPDNDAITDKQHFLSDPLSAGLLPYLNDPLREAFVSRTYAPRTVVMAEGDPLDSLYILVSGQAKVSASSGSGKLLLLRFCYPLSLFGELELLQQIDVQSQVETVTACTFLVLPANVVRSSGMHYPPFLRLLLDHLSHKLHTCTTASRLHALATAEERLAGYLLTIHHKRSLYALELHSTSTEEMAALLGTTTRHLNRVLRQWTKDGIVKKEWKQWTIVRPDQLEQLANGVRYD